MAKTYTYQGQRYNLPDGLTDAQALEKIQDYLAEQPEGVVQEFAEGVAGGAIEAGSGILQTGALVADLIYGTDYSSEISDATKDLKRDLGIDPAGITGELTQAITQFAVPGLGVAGIIGKAAKARNLGRAFTTTSQVAGAGAADALVASDGATTIGDFFGGGPTMTSKNTGLSGREEAGRQGLNKLKFAAEAAGVTATLPYALMTAAVAAGGAVKGARVASEVTGVSKGLGLVGSGLSKASQTAIEKVPAIDKVAALFRSRGMLPQSAFEVKSSITGKVDAALNKAGRIVDKLELAADKLFKDNEQVMIMGTPYEKSSFVNMIYSYITKDPEFIAQARQDAARRGLMNIDFSSADDLAQFLPESVRRPALEMRSQIDLLVRDIKRSDFVQSGVLPDIDNVIADNLGDYMRRKYAAFEDPKWFNSQEFSANRDSAIEFMELNPAIAKDLHERMIGPIDDQSFFIGVGANQRTDPVVATRIIDEFTERYKGNKGLAATGERWRTAQERLRTSLLTKKQIDLPVLRALLGEVKDPLDTFVSTINDLAEFKATNEFYDSMARNFIDDDAVAAAARGDDFLSEEAYANLPRDSALRDEYVQLGETPRQIPDDATPDQIAQIQGRDLAYGALQGAYVKKPIYNSLTRLTLGEGTAASNIYKWTYGAFLQGKGSVQYANTILSPITQIRNFTSSGLFATAQGNVGRGANVFESVDIVLNDIFKRTGTPGDEKLAELFQKYQELGVVGTQAQLKEIERLMQEGLGNVAQSNLDDFGVNVAKKKGFIRSSKAGRFVGGVGKKFSEFYQGGDDVWKIYNFEFEKSKLQEAVGGARQADEYAQSVGFKNADEYAADIVKNVVPNYERVPEAIRILRKAPLGNFIAFPAEIIRTSGNTLRYAIRELQSANPAIRDIGMRRLIGFTSTAGIAGPATAQLAAYAGGVGQDALDALYRVVAPWDQDATLVVTSTDKEGNPTGYINYSFINPYDYWSRPANAILRAVNKGEIENLDADQVVLDAGMGVISAMAGPFLQESIFAEKLLDVLPQGRGGKTKTGQRIYRTGSGEFAVDSSGEILAKSFAHVFEAFNPGFVKQVLGTLDTTPETGGQVGLKPSRLVDSLIRPGGRDPRGNVRQVEEEIARLATGITETDVRADNIVKYGSYQYGDAIRGAGNVFASALNVQNKINPDNLIAAYRDSNEKRYAIQSRMYRLVLDMKALGMKDRDIRRALKEFKVADADKIMKGVFSPTPLSDVNLSRAARRQREYGGKVPRRQLFQVRREYLRRPLSPAIPEKQEQEYQLPVSRPSVPETSQPVAAAVPPPSAAQAGVAPAPTATPAPRPSERSPILMGDNIESILKNLQLQGNR